MTSVPNSSVRPLSKTFVCLPPPFFFRKRARTSQQGMRRSCLCRNDSFSVKFFCRGRATPVLAWMDWVPRLLPEVCKRGSGDVGVGTRENVERWGTHFWRAGLWCEFVSPAINECEALIQAILEGPKRHGRRLLSKEHAMGAANPETNKCSLIRDWQGGTLQCGTSQNSGRAMCAAVDGR